MKLIAKIVPLLLLSFCASTLVAQPAPADAALPDAMAPDATATTEPAPPEPAPALGEADHEALRALLRSTTEAINTRQFDRFTPLLHPSFTVIAVDNTKLVGIDAFRAYWNRLFEGPEAMFISIEAKPVADALTLFLDDKVGVVYGTSEDTYTFRKNSVFKEGEKRTMSTRWSATVAKDGNDWKLVNVHFSANPFDNPMLDVAKAVATRYAIGAGLVGLVLGLLIMAALRRR